MQTPWMRAVDATAGTLAGGALAALSFLRRKRVFHPDGAAMEGTLTVTGGAGAGADLLDAPGEHHCVVRLSQGAGLPDALPDVLGVAVRVGGRQDLLFATVLGEAAPGRHVLAPTGAFDRRPFSTVLPYRTRAGRATLLLRPVVAQGVAVGRLEEAAAAFSAGALTFEVAVAVAGRGGAGVAGVAGVGTLRGGPRVPDAASEALRFNPFNAADDLQPAGALNALRRKSYGMSQAARPGA